MLSSSSMRSGLVPQAVALLLSFTSYGLLQEKIVTGVYNGTSFRSSVILVASNRLVGILVATYMQSQHLRNSLIPRQPLYAYAGVSIFNFLSTLCQYESLRHVNFTTQTLGKCSKVVPVLVLGVVLHGRKYPTRTYAAVGLIFLGMTLYVVTSDIIARRNQAASTFKGVLLLLGYLFFDGMVSTTEERLFKRPAKGPGPVQRMRGGDKSELVYDQMLWINLSSLAISAVALAGDPDRPVTALLNHIAGPDGPRLLLHIILLSLSASVGLIFLLNIIATYGALTCSTLMTTRQFISIVLNGIAFGSIREVGLGGWTGIGYVASGVWLELSNKRNRKEKLDEENGNDKAQAGRSSQITIWRSPVVAHFTYPFAAGLILRVLAMLVFPDSSSPTATSVLSPRSSNKALAYAPPKETFSYRGKGYSRGDVARLKTSVLSDPSTFQTVTPHQNEGHRVTFGQFYPGLVPRTALASFPRSGNTFTRELVEHSTGWFSTDVMCGKRVNSAYFKAACDHPENNFLVKTHDPELFAYPDMNETWKAQTAQFDRVVLVTRNPLDSFWSLFHLLRDEANHTSRMEGIEQLDLHYLHELDRMAQTWNQHTDHWLARDIPREVIRYEDLRGPDQVQHLARILTLLLPPEELPPIERLICADDDDSVAYQSPKTALFKGWDRYTDEVRNHILDAVAENWCRLGFENLLRQNRPGTIGVDCG